METNMNFVEKFNTLREDFASGYSGLNEYGRAYERSKRELENNLLMQEELVQKLEALKSAEKQLNEQKDQCVYSLEYYAGKVRDANYSIQDLLNEADLPLTTDLIPRGWNKIKEVANTLGVTELELLENIHE